MSKIFNVALVAILITSSTHIFASSKLFSKAGIHLKSEDEDSVITIGKSAAYTLAAVGTYCGAGFLGVDQKIRIAGTAGIVLLGLGDVAKNKTLKNLGANTILATLAVWTANGEITSRIPGALRILPNNNSHIERSFYSLFYYALYRSAYNLARKGYVHYTNKK